MILYSLSQMEKEERKCHSFSQAQKLIEEQDINYQELMIEGLDNLSWVPHLTDKSVNEILVHIWVMEPV